MAIGRGSRRQGGINSQQLLDHPILCHPNTRRLSGSARKNKIKKGKMLGNLHHSLFRYIVSIMQYLNRFLYVQRGGNQQSLIQSTTQKHHDIVRNRLLLASLFNFGTFLVLVFSMSYYDWGEIEIPFYVLNEEHSQEVVRGDLTLFFNLLYGKQLNVPYYQSYSQISKEVCLPNDIFCQSIFQELFCLGLLCFFVMGVGSAFQVYDIAMVVQELCGMRKVIPEEQADTLRYFVAIGHYLVGVTLNIFGLYLMQVEVFLGVSFWVFVGGVGLFVAVVIAQQVSLNHLRKQKLILDLMKGEKKMSNHLNTITIELSEESDAYI